MRVWLYISAVVLVVLPVFCTDGAGYSQDAILESESSQNNEPLGYSEFEVFLSFAISRPQLKGDFDGLTFFEGAGLVLLVPEVDPALGFGAALAVKRRLGRNLRNALGAEIYCFRSSHDGSWAGIPGDGVLWDVGAGLSWHFYADRRVQPYFKGYMGFTGFDFDVDEDLEVDTCAFAGTKWAFGFGLSVYLTPKWFLDIGMFRNSFRFGAPADIRSIVLDPPMTSTTFDFESRISYCF